MFATCVIGGYTGSMLIGPHGGIIDEIASEEEILAVKVAFTDEKTAHLKYADIFGWTIVGLFILLICYNLYFKRRSPYVFCGKCRAQMKRELRFAPSMVTSKGIDKSNH